MNCPHCNKRINAWSGLQELQKFQKHLVKCTKNPAKGKHHTLEDALNQRADSGQ